MASSWYSVSTRSFAMEGDKRGARDPRHVPVASNAQVPIGRCFMDPVPL